MKYISSAFLHLITYGKESSKLVTINAIILIMNGMKSIPKTGAFLKFSLHIQSNKAYWFSPKNMLAHIIVPNNITVDHCQNSLLNIATSGKLVPPIIIINTSKIQVLIRLFIVFFLSLHPTGYFFTKHTIIVSLMSIFVKKHLNKSYIP